MIIILIILALINIWIVIRMWKELRLRQSVIMELVIKSEVALTELHKESVTNIEQKIKNIPKEIVIKNVLKIP